MISTLPAEQNQDPCYFDDEASLSSALATTNNRAPQKQLDAVPQVSFDLSSNQEIKNTLAKEDLSEMWYTPKDFQMFREQTTVLAKALKSCSTNPLSYTSVLNRTYSACALHPETHLSPCEEMHLINCSDSKMLGMDRWVVKSRRERRKSFYSAFTLGDLSSQSHQASSKSSSLFAVAVAAGLAADVARDGSKRRLASV
jgi:hypothetical protein